jgi:hypothetical protein
MSYRTPLSIPPAARALAASLVLAAAAPAAMAQAFNVCGDLANAFGPYDYRKDRGDSLRLVESAHFNQRVESLIRGQTGKIGQDIDYVLRAYPNHHRALVSAMRLAERDKRPQPEGMNYSIDCYFDRAIRWQRDDLTVRMIFAGYLGRKDKIDDAKAQLAYVVSQAGDNPFTHYNAGLVYLELKAYKEALAQAHRAAELGFGRTELREKLQAAGQWSEPSASAPAASAAASAAAEPASAPSGASAEARP